MKAFALLAPLLFLVTLLTAQDTAAPSGPESALTPMHVVGIDVYPIPGKPFSGRDCVDVPNTNRVESAPTTHLDGALIARDRRGRIYREIRTWTPARPAPRSTLQYIMLTDPVAHTRTECKVATRSCAIFAFNHSSNVEPEPDGPFDTAPYYLHRESLGNDVIEGVAVEGTRITSSLVAGVFVNNEAPVASLDSWYSPDLEIDLSVTRNYKDDTAKVIHVVGLSRSEPDSALFKPPQGYGVEDRRSSTKAEE